MVLTLTAALFGYSRSLFPAATVTFQRMTPTPGDLPVEIVLFILDHAARRHVFTDRSWVASLCLVCRAARILVTPSLYHILDLAATPQDPALFDAYAELCVSHARVLIARSPRDRVSEPRLFRAHNARLNAALRNIDIVVCSFYYLYLLNQNLKPQAVLLKDLPRPYDARLPSESFFAHVTHLALPSYNAEVLVTFIPLPPLLSHMLVEMVHVPAGEPHFLRNLVKAFLEDARGLKRIVCRMATIPNYEVRARICEDLCALKDERVALNEDVAAEDATVEEIFVKDVLQVGYDSVWYSGAPVYQAE